MRDRSAKKLVGYILKKPRLEKRQPLGETGLNTNPERGDGKTPVAISSSSVPCNCVGLGALPFLAGWPLGGRGHSRALGRGQKLAISGAGMVAFVRRDRHLGARWGLLRAGWMGSTTGSLWSARPDLPSMGLLRTKATKPCAMSVCTFAVGAVAESLSSWSISFVLPGGGVVYNSPGLMRAQNERLPHVGFCQRERSNGRPRFGLRVYQPLWRARQRGPQR